jgi:hypothetical protein
VFSINASALRENTIGTENLMGPIALELRRLRLAASLQRGLKGDLLQSWQKCASNCKQFGLLIAQR